MKSMFRYTSDPSDNHKNSLIFYWLVDKAWHNFSRVSRDSAIQQENRKQKSGASDRHWFTDVSENAKGTNPTGDASFQPLTRLLQLQITRLSFGLAVRTTNYTSANAPFVILQFRRLATVRITSHLAEEIKCSKTFQFKLIIITYS